MLTSILSNLQYYQQVYKIMGKLPNSDKKEDSQQGQYQEHNRRLTNEIEILKAKIRKKEQELHIERRTKDRRY